MDTLLSPILDDLRACVCGALEGTLGGPADCHCAIVPGVEAAADWCSCKGGGGCGMAWVRVSRLYSSSQRFPAADSAPMDCNASVLAAVLEVGAYRCQPSSRGNGQPPLPADQTQAALVQADDSMALARAILCCDSITRRPFVLGAYTPSGGGACGGGYWLVTVQLTKR